MAEIADPARAELEHQKLRLEVLKLQAEVASSDRLQRLSVALQLLPTVTVLVTVLGFVFTVWQYRSEQKEKRAAIAAQSTKDSESAQREFMKPLIEKQQALYFEAADAAATIASSSDVRERRKATDTFRRLYWGPLVMVESTDVSGAMKNFGSCLDKLDKVEKCKVDDFHKLSLALASALEASMLKTWNAKPEEFTNNQFIYR